MDQIFAERLTSQATDTERKDDCTRTACLGVNLVFWYAVCNLDHTERGVDNVSHYSAAKGPFLSHTHSLLLQNFSVSLHNEQTLRGSCWHSGFTSFGLISSVPRGVRDV